MSHSDSDLTEAFSKLTTTAISPASPSSAQITPISRSLSNVARSRPHADSKNSAASTASSILSLVSEVSKAVSDVPYLGAIATVVTTLIKIREELEIQKERSQELLDKVLKKIESVFKHLLKLKDCSHRDNLDELNAQMQEYHDFLVRVVKIVSKLRKRKFHQRIFDRGTGELERLDRMINEFNTDLMLTMLVKMITTPAKPEQPQTSNLPETGNTDNIASHFPAAPVCILERDSQHHEIVAKLLSTPDVRVALLGMGGIGKTTLACSVARHPKIVDTYPRRLFLSFEGCSTPDLAYTNIANVFRIPSERRASHDDILSQVLGYLKQKKTLFVIDNFETFWEVPTNRRVAEDLIGQFATLTEVAIIVTLRGTQRPGDIRWLRIDPLQTLTHDASKELLSVITDVKFTEGDLEYVQKLLDGVAGIPLAVKLIGSLLRDNSETPRSLWQRWTRERTKAIGVANDTEPDDRLYKLDVSLRLSIFGPRISDNTKEVLAGIAILPIGLIMDENWLDRFQMIIPTAIDIRSCIGALRNVALCILDSTTSLSRLRLLPPVRDFCLENISLNSALAHKLIDMYITDLITHWDFGSSGDYTWVTMELSNISAILNLAITHRYISDNFGSAVNEYTEWQRLLCIPETDTVERAIEILSEHPHAKAACLRALGTTLSNTDREKEAIQPLEQALSIHRELEDKCQVGRDLYYLGNAYYRLDDYANAEPYLSEARDLVTEIDDKWNKGGILEALASIYLEQDKLPQAESAAKEALELERASGDRKGEVNALRTLGRVYRKQGKYDLAVETLTACRDASQAIHDTDAEACTNQSLGYVYRAVNKPDQAALHFRLAISLFERAQDFKWADKTRTILEELERPLGKPNDQ